MCIGFGGEYFQYEDEENDIVEDSKHNKLSSLQAYKTVLTSQSSEESLVILISVSSLFLQKEI